MNSCHPFWLVSSLAMLDRPAELGAQVPPPVGRGAIVRWRNHESDSYTSEGKVVWIRSDSICASVQF